MIYHGTPLTPRDALVSVCTGRAMCVSFFRPDDVGAVEKIAPFCHAGQRRVLRMEGGTSAWRALVYPRRLAALLRVVGATPFSSRQVGSHSRCTGSAKPAQRQPASRVAIRSKGCPALAYGRPDRTASAVVRAIRPGVLGMDRRRQASRPARVSSKNARGRSGFGQPMAGSAHDARHRGCRPIPLYQRGRDNARAERMAL